MEELRSTEILDKEIQEDARRKAERILKNADIECQRIADDVKTRAVAVRQEKEAAYTKRIALYQRDADAAVPLEQTRFLVSFEDKAVTAAIKAYVESLTEEKRLFLLRNLLIKFKPALLGKQADITVNGFPENKIEAMLKEELGSAFVHSCTKLADSKALEKDAFWGFLIETTDNLILCRVTISEILADILDSCRFELTNALFGGRLSQ